MSIYDQIRSEIETRVQDTPNGYQKFCLDVVNFLESLSVVPTEQLTNVYGTYMRFRIKKFENGNEESISIMIRTSFVHIRRPLHRLTNGCLVMCAFKDFPSSNIPSPPHKLTDELRAELTCAVTHTDLSWK